MKKHFEWLQHSDVIAITNALSIQNNPTFNFVGGCVRDSILGKFPKDFDIASTLTPEHNIKLLKKHNIKVIPFALQYGTIIAKLSTYTFEITTLRVDINNYGRYADVKFSTNYLEDAKRRDFTFNALYLNPVTLKINDFFNGINDLRKGKISFIGNIHSRIVEDYLRILRFVRFYTYFGKETVNADKIETIKLYVDKLLLLSKDRITTELNKIINHKNAVKGVKLLNKAGISLLLFKQLNLTHNKLSKLNNFANKSNYKIIYILKWLVLVSNPKNILNALNLTKQEIKLIRLVSNINKDLKLQYKASYFLARYEKNILINAIYISLCKTNNISQQEYLNNLLLEINIQRKFVFCISGKDLVKLNLSPGKKFGAILLQLKEWGIENNIHNKLSYLNKAKEIINS